VRKGSIANAQGSGGMRPRANTISHLDGAHMQMMANATVNVARNNVLGGHSRHPSLVGFPMHTNDFQFAGMSSSMGMRGGNHGLPKLETTSFNNSDIGGGLRTAPPMGSWGSEYNFGMFPSAGPGSTTINPSALHFSDSPQFLPIDAGSQYSGFADMSTRQVVGDNPEWMNGFEHQLSFQEGNENAIDESSPSAMSTTSQSGISEAMVDGSNNPAVTSASMWQQQMAPPQMNPTPFGMDMMTGYQDFQDFMNVAPISPYTLSQKNPLDPYFSTPPPSTSSHTTSLLPSLNTQGYHPPMNVGPETPISINGSMPGSVSTITENTRQSLVAALAQCTHFGSRKYTYPATSSPHLSGRVNSLSEARFLPSTSDLQRYVGAYIQYFHPHLPFLHIATLSFDVPAYNNEARLAGLSGGRGCLILSMAAIGALYEMDHPQSKELFDSAKKMIQLYLEERRKADVRKADLRKTGTDTEAPTSENSAHTPVWLVQAMLLNVVYGHNCGDKTAGDIASTHCAALVSLARAAELLKPQSQFNTPYQQDSQMDDHPMSDSWSNGGAYKTEVSDEQQAWLNWKTMEERKRTLYAVFILCSLLVSAYNHGPCLTNSEIMLDLPCDEEFWASETASSFNSKGGARMADHNLTTFHDALGELLRTSEKQQQQQQQQVASGQAYLPHQLPPSDLKPSTFGCLILINALHNYIWETRSRHQSDVWTNEETDKMHRHIEPALMAWQSAWNSNPKHSLERPNPYQTGPLSADSIPLLDLAYVRLFVNFTRSKDKFWERDFDAMADELRRGSESSQHTGHSPGDSNGDSSEISDNSARSSVFVDSPPTSNSSPDFQGGRPSQSNGHRFTSLARRERLLRKAAFFAVDHLLMSDKFNVTFADFTSRELPLQSAMCAFDCAQVLAEWIATVQERVGHELEAILGRDQVDPTSVPACMLLEEEDWKLFKKVQDVLNSAEGKINRDLANLGPNGLPLEHFGWGVKILVVTSYMLDKAAVWPITRLMARALEVQSSHIAKRAEDSIASPRSMTVPSFVQ